MYNTNYGKQVSNQYRNFIQAQVDYLDKAPYLPFSVGKMRDASDLRGGVKIAGKPKYGKVSDWETTTQRKERMAKVAREKKTAEAEFKSLKNEWERLLSSNPVLNFYKKSGEQPPEDEALTTLGKDLIAKNPTIEQFMNTVNRYSEILGFVYSKPKNEIKKELVGLVKKFKDSEFIPDKLKSVYNRLDRELKDFKEKKVESEAKESKKREEFLGKVRKEEEKAKKERKGRIASKMTVPKGRKKTKAEREEEARRRVGIPSGSFMDEPTPALKKLTDAERRKLLKDSKKRIKDEQELRDELGLPKKTDEEIAKMLDIASPSQINKVMKGKGKNRVEELLGGIKYQPVLKGSDMSGMGEKNSKAKARGALISKLMKEKGLTLPQASKYIKENNLKY